MRAHKIAELYPLIKGNEFESLCNSIRVNGLRFPIVTLNGEILDGRNRFHACEVTGVKPRFQEYEGGSEWLDLLAYVRDVNEERRHLNESQRSMIAAQIANMPAHRPNKGANVHPYESVSKAKAAKIYNVSPRMVAMAKRVLESAPAEVVSEIMDGKLAVSQYSRRITREDKLETISQGNKPLDGNGKRYSVIYADPPWKYDFSPSDSRAIERHYPTMELEEIAALPVIDIASDNAIIFLWCPPAFNEKALFIMKAWGFEFRTSRVWVKDKIGAGQWVRQRHELLLIGRRGDFPTPQTEDRPDSVIEAPRGEHSEKPGSVYDDIENMYPRLDRIELFSRNSRSGWDAWGNQA